MLRLFAVVLAWLLAVPAAAAQPQARLEARAAGFSAHVLANGFRVILVPFPSAGTTRIELVVKAGSLVEGPGETGMAHLLEHLLFKGAGGRASVKDDLARIGALWNATTTADRTSFFALLPPHAEALDEALRIEADRFLRARFTPQDLASEMSVVRNELDQAESDPAGVLARALRRQSFAWHGYGRPVLGARGDIEAASHEALLAFYRRHYRPDNAFLVVSGRFDEARVLALAARLFAAAGNPPQTRAAAATREAPHAGTTRSEIQLPAGRTLAMSGWRIPGAYQRQTLALALASAALCSPDWGSLRRVLVLERKAALSAGCSGWEQREAGLFVASAGGGAADDAAEMSRALAAHVEAAAARGITQEELERARAEALNAFRRAQHSHVALAGMFADAEVSGDWRLAFWQRDAMQEIDLEEANAALRAWLVAANRSDALLRHGEAPRVAALPPPVDAAALLAGRDWPAFARASDPLPATAAQMAQATTRVPLGEARVQAALMSRRTQGDMAWLVLANDFGNERALRGRATACRMAGALLGFGGAGLDRRALDARMEGLQARWDLGLGRLSIEAPRAHLQEALEVLLAVWASPALPAEEFERMKAAAIARTEAALRDPAAVAASLVELRFDNYPEAHPKKPLSLEQELAAIRATSYEEVRACQAEFSGLAHVRLALVGELSAEDVKRAWASIARLPWARVPYERVRDRDAPARVDTSRVVVALGSNPDAAVGGKATLEVSDSAEDFPALRIAVKILGGGADSRLWNRLREAQGLAYEAGAILAGSAFEARTEFALSASAAAGDAERALASLQEELARALREGFSEQEVERAKQAWLRERVVYAGNEALYAARLAQALLTGRDFAWIAQYDERIARVSAREATAALRKYLGAAPIVWMIGKGDAS